MHIYTKELLELDAKYGQYKAGSLEFKDYLNYLIGMTKSKGINIKPLANIYLLNQVLAEEEHIDFKKANNERDSLIDTLQKKLSRNMLEELVLKTIEFKAERISQKDFYSYLVNKSRMLNMDMEGFSQLQKYIAYVSMYDTIDKAKIMDELDTLENKLKEALIQNDKQKKLDTLSKNLTLTKNVFNISLIKEDYKYYKKNENDFNVRNYISFIDREAPLYKITARLDDGADRLDSWREEMMKFYEYSLKRDTAFVKNIHSSVIARPEGPKQSKNKTAILITGGFHTESLGELFKRSNISYISIMPNFKNDPSYECPYFNLLSGKKSLDIRTELPSVLNKALAIPAVSLCPAMRKAMGTAMSAPAAEKPEIDNRADLTRRAAVDRVVNTIKGYGDFEKKIKNIITKLRRGIRLDKDDEKTLQDLRRKLESRNSLVVLSRKVRFGDRIVTFNQQNIKRLNSELSAPQNDEVIRQRQQFVTDLLLKNELIESKEEGVLLMGYKQDKFVIKEGIIRSLGDEEVRRRLGEVSEEFAIRMKAYIESKKKGLGDPFGAYYGLSEPVNADTDDARILADIQALQASKMARRTAEAGQTIIYGGTFNQNDFRELMKGVASLKESLGLKGSELPSISEMESVRGISENNFKEGREKKIKKYLDIIDLFDYPKDWSANPEVRAVEKNRILGLLKLLKNSRARAPPPEDVEEAFSILETSTKNPKITSGEAFHYYAFNKSLKDPANPGRIVSADAIGFWASIQKNLSEACQNYMNGRSIVSESLNADDKIKEMMRRNADELIRILRDNNALTMAGASILAHQEGGDEIAFFVPNSFDLRNFADALSDNGIEVRLMASEINYKGINRPKDIGEIEFALSYTEVTHAPYGEAYVSAQGADKKAKDLEKLGLRALVSEEMAAQGKTEFFVYYKKGGVTLRRSYEDTISEFTASTPGVAPTSPAIKPSDYSQHGLPITAIDRDALLDRITTSPDNYCLIDISYNGEDLIKNKVVAVLRILRTLKFIDEKMATMVVRNSSGVVKDDAEGNLIIANHLVPVTRLTQLAIISERYVNTHTPLEIALAIVHENASSLEKQSEEQAYIDTMEKAGLKFGVEDLKGVYNNGQAQHEAGLSEEYKLLIEFKNKKAAPSQADLETTLRKLGISGETKRWVSSSPSIMSSTEVLMSGFLI